MEMQRGPEKENKLANKPELNLGEKQQYSGAHVRW